MARFTEQPYDQVIRSEGIVDVYKDTTVVADQANVGLINSNGRMADEAILASTAARTGVTLVVAARFRNHTILVHNTNAADAITVEGIAIAAATSELFLSDGFGWINLTN